MKKIKHLFKTTILIISTILILQSCNNFEKDWIKTKEINTLKSFQDFRIKYPQNIYDSIAIKNIEKLMWNQIKEIDSIDLIVDFKNKFPNSVYDSLATEKLTILQWNKIKDTDSISLFVDYQEKYPNNIYSDSTYSKILNLQSEKLTSIYFPELEKIHLKGKISGTSYKGDIKDGVQQFQFVLFFISEDKNWLPLFSFSVPTDIVYKNYFFDIGKECEIFGWKVNKLSNVPVSDIQVRRDSIRNADINFANTLSSKEKEFYNSEHFYKLLNHRDKLNEDTFNKYFKYYLGLQEMRIYFNYIQAKKHAESHPLIVEKMILK